jgi:hypothetical protein
MDILINLDSYPKGAMIPTKIVICHTKPAMTFMIIIVLGKLQTLASLSRIEMPVCTVLSFHKRYIYSIGD